MTFEELRRRASDLPSLQLDAAAAGLLELYFQGAVPAFVPPAPVSGPVALRDPSNIPLAIFTPETGLVEFIEAPPHADFAEFRRTPDELRNELGGAECLAVATADFLTEPMLEQLYAFGGCVVVHLFEHGPVDHFVRVRAARAVLPDGAILNVLPIADPGPEMTRVILSMFGATEVLEPKAGPYPPFVAAILDEIHPPLHRQGFCVWFTGLPSSGKSTIAAQLQILLKEHGRTVTMLDGDVVRMNLSKGLGFSREDRDTNIRRIGFVAGEIVKHHGVVIAAAVSPYQASRDHARRSVGDGRFVLVYVATPPEVCEQRDVKGFYAKARAGGMTGMTGVDDPYEVPSNADVVLGTTAATAREGALAVAAELQRRGFLI